MDMESILVVAGALAALVVVAGLVVWRCFHRVVSGTALIVSRPSGPPVVCFEGGRLVVPIVQRAEVIDLTSKTVRIVRRGADGLSCQDGIRADVEACFLVRIEPKAESVLRVAGSLGCVRASDAATVQELFQAKCEDVLRAVARRFEFDALVCERERFRDEVIEVLSVELSGFVLEDLVLERLEQTPIDQLNPDNVLDARGIQKLRERLGKRPAPSAADEGAAAAVVVVDPAPLLPSAAGGSAVALEMGGTLAGASFSLRLRVSGERLELWAGATAQLSIDLRQPFTVQVSRGSSTLNVALRQRLDGLRVEVEVSSPLFEYLEALGADAEQRALCEGLARLEARAIVVRGAELVGLLARVRYAQEVQGVAESRWLR